ncbi:MAG: hypothetical protein WCK41_00315 [Actinomycetes bacterium]
MEDDILVIRGLLGAAAIDGSPTAEQINVLQSLVYGYMGLEVDLSTLDPASPAEFASGIPDNDRHRAIDLLALIEFCRHPSDPRQADLVETYADALGLDEPLLVVARDVQIGARDHVLADWSRYQVAPPVTPGIDGERPQGESQFRHLEDCPADSLGRAFFDHYQRWNLTFPDEPGGGGDTMVGHDFTHVLADYEPDPPGEIALQAMLLSATNFDHHFSSFIAALAFNESKALYLPGLFPTELALTRPGAADELADGFRRGVACTKDFSAIPHLELVDEPLEKVRKDCGIVSR